MDDAKDSLFQSVAFGTTEELNELDLSGTSVDSSDQFGNSLLHYACAHGNTDGVLFLLGLGASVEWQNAVGWIPIHQACRYGHIDVVRLLSRQGAGLSKITALGASCTALAVAGGHLEVLEFLVSLDCPLTSKGFPLITLGAQRSNLPCLRYLVARCSLDSTASCGVSALEAAAAAEDEGLAMDAARLLLAMGADPDAKNAAGATPSEVAAALNRPEVAQLVRQHRRSKKRDKNAKDGGSEVRKSAPNGFSDDPIDVVKRNDEAQLQQMILTNRKGLVEFKTEDGATPLMFAGMLGYLGCCQLLIDAGCDVDKQDEVNGWTALMQAIFHNQKNVVRLLLQHKANPEIRSKNDLTVLDIALLCEGEDNKEIVSLLSPEKSQRNEHRRMFRRLEDLGLSDANLSSATYSSRSRFWGAMTRRLRPSRPALPPAPSWAGSSTSLGPRSGTSRLSAALSRLAEPFRRGSASRRVRFREEKAARPALEPDQSDANAQDVLPPAPVFVPPHMNTEETVQGIREIRASLHAELDLKGVAVFAKNDPALPSPLLSGSSSTLVASTLSLSASTSTLQASGPSSTSSEQGGLPSLPRLLQQLGCEHLTPVFETHEIDLESFACLSEADLHEMGIDEPRCLRTLLDAIAAC